MGPIKFTKFLDRTFGRLACEILIALSAFKARSAPSLPGTPSKILVIRPGGIGDAVLLFPLLAALKNRFPSCELHILAEKRNAEVFQANSVADHIYLREKLFNNGLLKVLRTKFDMIFDTEQFHYSPAVLAFLNGAKVRCGFNTNRRGHLFTHKTDYNHQTYEANSFLDLYFTLTGERIPFDHGSRFFPLDERYREEARAAYARLKGKKTVAILMGASIPERRWESAKYTDIISWLLSQQINVVLCDPSDNGPVWDPILAEKHLLNFRGSLPQVAGLIAESDTFLSSDTGILHIAYGLGIPTVSLFGPGIMAKWAPRGENHKVITKNVPCSPCTRFGYTPPCRNDQMCMATITVEEVQAAISALLKI